MDGQDWTPVVLVKRRYVYWMWCKPYHYRVWRKTHPFWRLFDWVPCLAVLCRRTSEAKAAEHRKALREGAVVVEKKCTLLCSHDTPACLLNPRCVVGVALLTVGGGSNHSAHAAPGVNLRKIEEAEEVAPSALVVLNLVCRPSSVGNVLIVLVCPQFPTCPMTCRWQSKRPARRRR
jgi:hypothetical protein